MQTSGLVELNRFLFAACARACALTNAQTTALWEHLCAIKHQIFSHLKSASPPAAIIVKQASFDMF